MNDPVMSDFAIVLHGVVEAIGWIALAAIVVLCCAAVFDRIEHGPNYRDKARSPFLRAFEQRLRRK